jgi:hypothetical protein
MQTRLNKPTRIILATETARELSEGTELELLAPGFSMVKVGDFTGWVESAAIQQSGATIPPGPQRPSPVSGTATGALQLIPFQGRNFTGNSAVVDASFAPLLEFVDVCARELQLQIHVTSSFRQKDAAIVGAVVPPAQRSNHLVGHAIDMNVIFGGELFNSVRLARRNHSTLPAAVLDLLNRIRSHDALRWGGDFARADPVHIDDDLARRDPGTWAKKFASL